MVKDKKAKKAKRAKKSSKAAGAKAAAKLQALSRNPLVADVVAAALVATASALKDSRRARALAAEAGDELNKLSRAGAERGSALWNMALEIGRRSLEALALDEPAKPKSKPKAKAKSKPKAAAKPKPRKRKATKPTARAPGK